MITYELDRWNILFAFSLKGSVFPRAFVMAFASSLLAAALHIAMHQSDNFAEVVGAGAEGTNILSGFTFILGFLIVFRSQQAYSRWWEGGAMMQQLRGQWYNAISTLFAFCNSASDRRQEVLKFQHHLARMVSLQYAFAIAAVSSRKDKLMEVLEISGFDSEDIKFLQSDECYDPCEVVLQWLQRIIAKAEADGVLQISPPMLARVFNVLSEGMINLSNGRKIMEFPIPFPLAQMITVMLLFHGIATPLICATTIPTPYWACFLCFVVCFSYWTINYIATELEMPFGEDDNDLPLNDMLNDMNASLMTLLTDQAMKCPSFRFHDKQTSRPGVVSLDFDSDFSVVCTSTPMCKAAVRRSEAHEPKRRTSLLSSLDAEESTLGRRRSSVLEEFKQSVGHQEEEEQLSSSGVEESQEKKQVKADSSCLYAVPRPEQEVAEPRDINVRIEEGCNVEMAVGAGSEAASSQAMGQARQGDQDVLSKAQASALSQLQGFCDIRPVVPAPKPSKDLEAEGASPAGSSSVRLRSSTSRSPSKLHARSLHQDSSTVIQVRATACCMPLTPGARLDTLQAVSCRRSAALHMSSPPPRRGPAALQR